MITSKQRAQLRAMANTMETIFQVGKGGIGDAFIAQLDDVLRARELIKVRVLETAGISAKEAANSIAPQVHAEIVQVIGTRFVLFRQNTEDPVIKLVK